MLKQQFLPRINSLLGVLLLVSCSPSASQPTNNMCAPEFAELEFGISSSESQANLKQQWEPLLAVMAEAIGRPVNGLYATDYAGVIEAMGASKIQVAWYGGKAYIEAAKRSQAEAFVRAVGVEGSQGYYSHLITNRENPILKSIDLEAGNGDQYVIENASDLTFAFNDPNSTSGYLVPSLYVFAENNIDPNTAFDELVFSGSHEATALAAANDQVDVATNNSGTLEMMEQLDPETREKIQVIWTSPIIPTAPLAYRSDLPDCLKNDIRTFFYDYQDSDVLTPMGWSDFIPAEDKDWNPIRELDIGKQILDVQNNQSLSDAVKQQQIDQLNQQLKALKITE
ncbi:phosphonate ABC transporter substrate-binding protein [Leptolyngbya cf. ectocarpi LEGE 11479]|uniref:Phosphonate ABC transporter substrate-binding protein n=1 Tax=Leptolyngbya cf. ectocarpi LEGE 11479 TaxID=1828722 RepID=A0A928WZJ3_LEPEC|nr:phosphonate ABC transporter substrate-binding protein [Leptolyngbya ectocarpi]MBE9066202.1 phosphonate ABC transporter substrate-binding protein [Leptolyngbya cf. ectocarpi LEGE 11479]